MADRLAQITAAARRRLAAAAAAVPLEAVRRRAAEQPPPRPFIEAICRVPTPLAVIAEAKRRSPSRGQLAADYDPGGRARLYQDAGAACMSVLTEGEFFGGSPADLAAARQGCALPVLRKDFIVDPYQVYETRAIGADCMLLIAEALPESELVDLAALGAKLGLAVLVEIHSADRIEAALACKSGLIGINNRDLRTFAVDLGATEDLAPRLAGCGCTLVSESAIAGGADAARAKAAGVHAVLVGEALMRASDPAALLAEIAGAQPE